MRAGPIPTSATGRPKKFAVPGRNVGAISRRTECVFHYYSGPQESLPSELTVWKCAQLNLVSDSCPLVQSTRSVGFFAKHAEKTKDSWSAAFAKQMQCEVCGTTRLSLWGQKQSPAAGVQESACVLSFAAHASVAFPH